MLKDTTAGFVYIQPVCYMLLDALYGVCIWLCIFCVRFCFSWFYT